MIVSDFVLEAKNREDTGRGASRRLRHQGLIPAVVYGAKKPAQALVMPHDALMHASEKDAFYASILELKIDGKKQKVIIKALQRHAYKPKLVHADFLRISSKTKINVAVPIQLHGEEDAPGFKDGGVLMRNLNEIEVSCLPADLPESIDIDITDLELDGVIRLSDLSVPEGVTIVALEQDDENDTNVLGIHIPKEVVEEEPETTEGEEGEEGEGEAEGEAESEAEAGEGATDTASEDKDAAKSDSDKDASADKKE